jgi:cytochrome c-type biogenesis protein CcmE
MLARILIALGFLFPYLLAPIARPIWLTFGVAFVAFGAGRLFVHLVKKPKVQLIVATGVLATGGVAAVPLAFRESGMTVSYLEATEVAASPGKLEGKRLSLHGHVAPGSLAMSPGATRFALEGGVRVAYDGTLPDGFRERTEVTVTGRLVDGVFQAETLLAKCPSNYNR